MSGAAPTTCPARGASLKDTVARVLPYTMREILPRVMRARARARSRSPRQLAPRLVVMVLDGLTTETIPGLELHYRRAAGLPPEDDTTVASKEVLDRDLSDGELPEESCRRPKPRRDALMSISGTTCFPIHDLILRCCVAASKEGSRKLADVWSPPSRSVDLRSTNTSG